MDKFDEKARELNRHDHFRIERGQRIEMEPCQRCVDVAQFGRDIAREVQEEEEAKRIHRVPCNDLMPLSLNPASLG